MTLQSLFLGFWCFKSFCLFFYSSFWRLSSLLAEKDAKFRIFALALYSNKDIYLSFAARQVD